MLQFNLVMYSTAAYIVEKHTGLRYPEFAKHRIFKPLGLSSATFDLIQAFESGQLAEGFIVSEKNVTGGKGWQKHKYRPIPYWNDVSTIDMDAGASGVIASANDLVCVRYVDHATH